MFMSVHSPIGPKASAKSPRQSRRARVLMSATLHTPAGPKRVTVRDISRNGAQVASRDEIPGDCDVLFERGGVYAAARVMRVSDGEAGIRFYRELSRDEIDGTLPSTLLRAPR